MVRLSFTDGTIIEYPEVTLEPTETTDIKNFIIIKGGKIIECNPRRKFNR